MNFSDRPSEITLASGYSDNNQVQMRIVEAALQPIIGSDALHCCYGNGSLSVVDTAHQNPETIVTIPYAVNAVISVDEIVAIVLQALALRLRQASPEQTPCPTGDA